MSDDFEKNLRDHLHSEAEETREFPRRLRGRIRDGIAPRSRARMVPQLALAGALVLVALAVLAVRNPHVIFNDVPSTIKSFFPQPTPSPTPQPFTCIDRTGGTTGASSQLKTVRTAPHPGYDRIVFEFTGQIPSYDLSRQDSATFVRDASGQPVTLDGSVGIKLVFRNTDATSGVPADARPALTSVKEIAQIGNFERVLSYGIGLASSQCVRVLELSGPARLVVDVATTTSASTTAAPTPLPTLSPSGTDLGAFSCLDRSGGGNTGPAMQLTAVRVAHQPGFDRIVFDEFHLVQPRGFGLCVEEGPGRGKFLGRPAAHQVAQQRERRAGEADERHSRRGIGAHQPDALQHEWHVARRHERGQRLDLRARYIAFAQ